VLPIYDIEYDTGKGPRIFGSDGGLVAPDLLVINHNGVLWIEAKHKTVFTWHRNTKRWTTGIDRNHYEQYLKVQDAIGWPVWLLFLHRCSTPDVRDRRYCPEKCPTGLFGQQLSILKKKENHRHGNWGPSGMVYWWHESLRELASIEAVNGQ